MRMMDNNRTAAIIVTEEEKLKKEDKKETENQRKRRDNNIVFENIRNSIMTIEKTESGPPAFGGNQGLGTKFEREV